MCTHRPPPTFRVVALLIQIAEGMAYLHSQQVCHRDLKPENVLLRMSSTGGAAEAVVGDFGTASRGPVHTGAKIGTPSYMAPEVVNFSSHTSSHYDTSVDVFSFAMLMYVSLARRRPFENLKKAEAVASYFGRPFTIRCCLSLRRRSTMPSLVAYDQWYRRQLIQKCKH